MLSHLLAALLPTACAACRAALAPAERVFCAPCVALLTADDARACPRCAADVGAFAEADPCARCRSEDFRFVGVTRMGLYAEPLSDVILRGKRASGYVALERLAGLFAESVAPKLAGVGVDAVVPVPLHWLAWARRGFNVAEELARPLAERLGVPCSPGLLRRVRATEAQKGKSPAERRRNVEGAFAASPRVRGRALLLVDDVLTGGSTADAAARALRAAGAASVRVAVAARAGLPDRQSLPAPDPAGPAS